MKRVAPETGATVTEAGPATVIFPLNSWISDELGGDAPESIIDAVSTLAVPASVVTVTTPR